MTRRCFLHVGCPKTGTTYLQNVLWGSPGGLERQGFRLALEDPSDHFFLTLALRNRVDPAVDPPRAVGVLERFEQDLSRAGEEDVIVSHELLAAASESAVEGFLDLLHGFDVHVVVTARDLARQVPAEWQQHVKTRVGTTYHDFVAGVVNGGAKHFWAVQDVPSLAARWGRMVPPERVHIVTLPPEGVPSDMLLKRFCAAMGIDAGLLNGEQPNTNPSIGYEQAELLRRVNVALGDRLHRPRAGYNKVVKRDFAEKVLARQERSHRLVLPPERWEWCRAVSLEVVERIERAGYEVVGDLADLVPGPPPAGQVLEPSEADVTAAAVEAIASMLHDEHRRRRAAAAVPGRASRSVGHGVIGRFGQPARRVARKLRG